MNNFLLRKVGIKMPLSFISAISIFVISFSGCGGESSPSVRNLADTTQNNISFPLYLKTKKEFNLDLNVTTNYEYNNNGYLIKSVQTTSDNSDTITQEYRYFEDHKVLKIYQDDILVKLATFKPRHSSLNYNVASSSKLSLVSDKQYLYNTFDTVIYHNNLQVKSVITQMRFGLNYVDRFSYRYNDSLKKIEEGRYSLSSDVQTELSNDNNTSFLLNSNIFAIPFEITQAQNYLYTNNTLKTIQFDLYDDGDIEISSDLNVSYYPSGLIKQINMSTGESRNYNKNGILISIKTAKDTKIDYTYTNDNKTITLTDINGKVVKEYIFDELKTGRL